MLFHICKCCKYQANTASSDPCLQTEFGKSGSSQIMPLHLVESRNLSQPTIPAHRQPTSTSPSLSVARPLQSGLFCVSPSREATSLPVESPTTRNLIFSPQNKLSPQANFCCFYPQYPNRNAVLLSGSISPFSPK